MRKEILTMMGFAGLVAKEYDVELKTDLDYDTYILGFKWFAEDGSVVSSLKFDVYEMIYMRTLEGYKKIIEESVRKGLFNKGLLK